VIAGQVTPEEAGVCPFVFFPVAVQGGFPASGVPPAIRYFINPSERPYPEVFLIRTGVAETGASGWTVVNFTPD
jgi:hypothetical protein